MRPRGPFARVLLWTVLCCVGALAVAGGLAMRGSGLVAIGVVGLLAGCTVAGIVRETGARSGRSVLEAGVQVTAGSVAALLAVGGISALAGGTVAVLVVLVALVGALVIYLRRASRRATGVSRRAPGLSVLSSLTSMRPAPRPSPVQLPVTGLSTGALGQDWIRTSALLAGRLDPAARQSLVLRREQLLDELERRDPVGFARWLAAAPALGTDPAEFVRGGPVAGGVADTDAA